MKINYSPKSRQDLKNIKVSIIAEFDDIGLAGRILKAILGGGQMYQNKVTHRKDSLKSLSFLRLEVIYFPM